MTTQRAFDIFLQRFLEKVSPLIDPVQMVKAPNWWLHAHQQMRTWLQYMNLPRPGGVPNPE